MTDCCIKYIRDQGMDSTSKIMPATEIKWHFRFSFNSGIIKHLQERHLIIDNVVYSMCIGRSSSTLLLKEQTLSSSIGNGDLQSHLALASEKVSFVLFVGDRTHPFFSLFKDYKGHWVTTQGLKIQ